MSDTVLSLRKATKLYAGVPAIEGVDFDLRRGEIHALVGENGAGKSTLTKVMAGVVTLTSGSMTVDGSDVAPRTPLEARNLGIAMVFQENSLVPTMTVAQNLFLGQEKFYNRLRGIYIAAQQFLQSLNFDVTPTATVGGLGAAKKQMVEIARAVLHKAKVIIFDEPTASLTPEEKKYFFDLVRDLKKRGVSIVFISHALAFVIFMAAVRFDRPRSLLLSRIGLISYSMYLFHWPVNITVYRVLPLTGQIGDIATMLICSGLVLLVSWLVYRLVERPMIMFGRAIVLRHGVASRP
jgi:ABC-type sugar transport system ATPase subunit